jgi:hypothetical protein
MEAQSSSRRYVFFVLLANAKHVGAQKILIHGVMALGILLYCNAILDCNHVADSWTFLFRRLIDSLCVPFLCGVAADGLL